MLPLEYLVASLPVEIWLLYGIPIPKVSFQRRKRSGARIRIHSFRMLRLSENPSGPNCGTIQRLELGESLVLPEIVLQGNN